MAKRALFSRQLDPQVPGKSADLLARTRKFLGKHPHPRREEIRQLANALSVSAATIVVTIGRLRRVHRRDSSAKKAFKRRIRTTEATSDQSLRLKYRGNTPFIEVDRRTAANLANVARYYTSIK
jgi:hypothetical protein